MASQRVYVCWGSSRDVDATDDRARKGRILIKLNKTNIILEPLVIFCVPNYF